MSMRFRAHPRPPLSDPRLEGAPGPEQLALEARVRETGSVTPHRLRPELTAAASADLLVRCLIERGLGHRTGRDTYGPAPPLSRSFIRRRRQRTRPPRSATRPTQPLTPDQRRLRGRMAAAILHSRYDSRALTRQARLAFLRKFLDEVDPDGRLPETERLRRAEQARRAHFLRLALASSAARRKRRLNR